MWTVRRSGATSLSSGPPVAPSPIWGPTLARWSLPSLPCAPQDSGGSDSAIEAAGEWVQPFADLVDQVDSALGDLPVVCRELVDTFDAHLDRLGELWEAAGPALDQARRSHGRVNAARQAVEVSAGWAESAVFKLNLTPVDDPTAALLDQQLSDAHQESARARGELEAAESALARARSEWLSLREAEHELDQSTARRISDQHLWDLKDPGRLQSWVATGWAWVSDLDNLHIVLDIAGMVPVVGNVADGINAAMYLLEGDWENAAMSGLAFVPGAGLAAGAAKLASRADRVGDARRAVEGVGSAAHIAHPATGNPRAIVRGLGELSNRQRGVLDNLPTFGAETITNTKGFGVTDLAALTASTGDEFAMFTTGGRRLVVRGGPTSVPIGVNRAQELSGQGWRWSAHTHPGTSDWVLQSSPGDRAVLEAFGQGESVIYNSLGGRRRFTPDGDLLGDWLG